MKFEPKNRHLLVEVIEEEEEQRETGGIEIYYPDGYEKPKTPYVVCKILDIAPNPPTPPITLELYVSLANSFILSLIFSDDCKLTPAVS